MKIPRQSTNIGLKPILERFCVLTKRIVEIIVPSTATTASITAQQAKEIALQQAGLAESSIYDLEIELERENGTLCYKVEFESAGMDYEYEIDATTGAILSMG